MTNRKDNMSYCKECFEEISSECMLNTDICVFCHYKINTWENNGYTITKKQSIKTQQNIFLYWHNYYKKYYKDICLKLKTLIKGIFVKKIIKGYKYYYLVYRKNGKITFDYYGKKRPKSILTEINLRINLKKKLRLLEPTLQSFRIIKRPGRRFNRFEILERDKFTCQYCGKTADEVKLDIDHIIPLSKGGSNTNDNLITSCEKCNCQKHTKVIHRKKV